MSRAGALGACLLVAAAIGLYGCERTEMCPAEATQAAPVAAAAAPVAAPATTVVVAPTAAAPAGGHDTADMLMAGGLGYLAGRAHAAPAAAPAPRTVVVNKTVVNKTVVTRSAPRYTAPPRSSFSGGRRR